MRKKLSAKIGSLVLSLCMVATLFSGVTPVFADTTANQIGSYYETYKIDSEGQIDTTNNAASSSSSQTIENGLVTMEKTIRPTGTENVFDVTLKVTTQEDLQTFDRSPDAAVVFVMDTSNSMKWDMEGNEKNIAEKDQRITKAKAAANKFLESYIKDADGAKRLISIVEFGSNAQTVAGWTNINSAAALEEMKNVITNDISVNFERHKPCDSKHTYRGQKSYWVEAMCTYPGCNNTDPSHKHYSPGHDHYFSFKFESWWEDAHCEYRGCDKTDSLHTHEGDLECEGDGTHQISLGNDGGGTNIEAGLMLAKNLLNAKDSENKDVLDGISNIYVILLTDGVPTFHVADDNKGNFKDNTSMYYIPGEQGGGDEAKYKDYKDVPGIASTITTTGTHKADLFSIFYGSNDDKEVGEYDNASDWLQTFVSKNYDAKDSDKLDLALGKIVTTIKNMAEAWEVTDPMGNYMTFDQEYNKTSNEIYVNNAAAFRNYNTATATLNWNLKKDIESRTEKTLPSGLKEYTYTLTYRIKLNNLSAGFEAEKYYPTNKTTTLEYMLTKGVDEDVNYELKTANFKTPTVMGFVEDLLQFKKVGPDNNKGLAGAEFALIDENGNEIAKTTSGTGQGQGNDIGNVRFSNIPSGHTYTLRETKAPEGYETCEDYTVKVEYGKATIFDKDGNALNNSGSQMPKITNVPDSKKMDLEVIKEWKGSNGEVPSISVTLKKTIGTDTTTVETVLLTKAENALPNGNWSYTFKDLPTVDVNTGADIIYSVEESAISGYAPTYSAMEKVKDQNDQAIGLKLTITNVAKAETSVTIQKKWQAPENRKTEVEVELLYKTSADSAAKSFMPEKTVKLNSGNGYEATISGLEKFDGTGELIEYSAKEITVLNGFDSAIPSTGGNGELVLTNRVAQEKVSVNGTKYWNDHSNAYESRPESIEVELYKDGEATGITQTVSAVTDPETDAVSWDFSFTELDKYALGEGENGHEIVYSVKEVGEENGFVTCGSFTYKVEYSSSDFSITNTLTDTTSVQITKKWVLAEDTQLDEHAGVTVRLLQNGVEIAERRMDKEMADPQISNQWFVTIENLPVYDSTGKKYVYTITEDPVEGFTPSTDVERNPQTNAVINPYHLILTNTDDKITNDKVSVSVTKQWFDTDKTARPASIQFNILANGEAIADSPYTMDGTTDTDSWQLTIGDLPKYDSAGQTIVYTVQEINVDSAYESNGEVNVNAAGGALLTNVIRQDEVSVSGSKVWDDGSNALGKRPQSITVILKADGAEVERQVLNASDFIGEDAWNFTFENLPKYSYTKVDGKVTQVSKIVYTVDETANETDTTLTVPAGYVKSISGNTITNTLTGVVNVPVTKDWNDGSNIQGKRPTEVTVVLEQYNGAELVNANYRTLTLSGSGNQWTDTNTFKGLPLYSEDKTIEYSYKLKEVNVPEGYTSVVVGNTITNTMARTTTNITVSKQWVGPIPENTELQMVLFRTTDPTAEKPVWEEVQTLTLPVVKNGETLWTATAENLDIYDSDYRAYTYKVMEQNPPAGYEASYNGFVVTNTVVQKQITVSGEKHWRGIPEGSNYLPSEITVELLADGSVIQETKTSAAQDWKYEFTGLDQYDLAENHDGHEIEYTIKEKGVENGTISFGQKDENGYEIRFQSSNNGYDLNNEYINPETYSYRVTSSYTTITDDVRGTTEWVVDKDATYLHKDENGNKPEADINAKDYENYQDNTYTLVSASIDDVKVVVPEKENIEDYLKFILEKAGHEYKVVLNFEREVKTPPTPPIIVETDHKVIVNYLEEGTETVLSSPSAQVVEHSQWYDVTDLTELVINGYDRVSVSGGKVSGYAYGNVVINVYYKQADTTEKYHSITVNYLDEASGESIADSYVTTAKEGDSYDVTSQDQIAIEGYDYVRTEGDALTGTATKDMVINVYYSELTDIDDGDVPLDDDPFDEDGDETVDIEDGDVPKAEDPNVPNTGDETNKGLWFSLFGISAISLAVLLFGKKRKTEEE
jgi:Mg-chelatase subunit ChlD